MRNISETPDGLLLKWKLKNLYGINFSVIGMEII
jgi:hypothetical protein